VFEGSLISFFPGCFAGVPGYGNVFDVLLHERDSPRLLKLFFHVVFKTCRAYPYLAMNEDMRSGTIIKALISSCNAFPEIILDVISSSLVLWPVSIYSAKDKNWRIPKSEPVFRVGDINSLGQLSNDDEVSIKGHLMVSLAYSLSCFAAVFLG
jgi:hypothetical protein